MRISDWSSDVCSSDLRQARPERRGLPSWRPQGRRDRGGPQATCQTERRHDWPPGTLARCRGQRDCHLSLFPRQGRSEEHTSELKSLMRISYAVFCLKKKMKSHEIELDIGECTYITDDIILNNM